MIVSEYVADHLLTFPTLRSLTFTLHLYLSLSFFGFVCTLHRERETGIEFVGFGDKTMAAPPAKARADYDYLIKLLLIGDSG